MLLIFCLLIVALLAKDATPLGDRYVLRALSEGTACLAGIGWLATSGGRGVTWRHSAIFLYIGALGLGLLLTATPLYVALQILAVVAIVLFSLAFLDVSVEEPHLRLYATRTMLIALTMVCSTSLAVKLWDPAYVYEQTFEGPRFRGLFSKPAMMGAASGILLGLSLFVPWRWGIRAVAFAAGLPCLLLTGSRTFWAASLLAVSAASFRHALRRGRYTWILVLMTVLIVCVGAVGLRAMSQKEAKFLRQDSLDTLSGRTAIWAQALERYKEHPWLGYGFTTGGQVLNEEGKRRTAVASRQSQTQGSITLHNGYVQALLDSGIVGGVLYAGVIAFALACFMRYDKVVEFGAEFYSLLFLAVSNFGETVIFGAGVLHGVWFWYVTVLASTLPSIASGASQGRAATIQAVSGETARAPALPSRRRFSLVASPKGLT
jgi:O-antigen ligase